ncbi:MAG: hypothetical protein ACK41P_03070 [Asticcacaulis sp.]
MKLPFAPLMLSALALACVASPTLARDYDYRGYDHRRESAHDFSERYQQTQFRIERGRDRGTLTRGEARRLHRELQDLGRLTWHYKRTDGHLNRWERRELDERYDQLNRMIRYEKRDDDMAYRRY